MKELATKVLNTLNSMSSKCEVEENKVCLLAKYKLSKLENQ